MSTLVRVTVALSLLAVLTSAQSRPTKPPPVTKASSRPAFGPPDDRYVRVLAGKKLEEGKGFPGLVEVGDPLSKSHDAFGNGREDFDWPFWFFYDKGRWQLTICSYVELGRPTVVHAIIVAGDGAPPTSKGIRVGDPMSKVIEAYGPAQPFDGALVGLDRKGTTRTRIGVGSGGGGTSVIEDPPAFKGAQFFPSAKLLVAVEKDRVKKLAIVGDEESLPDFLLPPDRVPENPSVKFDPSVIVPQYDTGKPVKFRVPSPPELVDHKGDAFTALVPREWKIEDDGFGWKDPKSVESVGIRVMNSNPSETPELVITMINESMGAENLVPKHRRTIPPDFLKMVGAESGFCAVTIAPGRGKEGLPLRLYQVMFAKGNRRYSIIVTRTQHPQRRETSGGGFEATAFMGCPDGDAIARGVIRSFRITE